MYVLVSERGGENHSIESYIYFRGGVAKTLSPSRLELGSGFRFRIFFVVRLFKRTVLRGAFFEGTSFSCFFVDFECFFIDCC